MRPFIIVPALTLFSFLIYVTFFGVSIGLSGKVDFRQLYTAGYMVRTGHGTELYDYARTQAFQDDLVSRARLALPFNHLAYESLLYAPLSFLKYRTAYGLFFFVNLALLAASFRMMRPYLSALAEIWTYLPAAIFACFFPVAVALTEGQDSIILLALMSYATVMVHRGHNLRGGILVGLTLFKFQYALPVVLLFAIWRCWRFLSGFAVSAAVLVSVSLWITGLAGFVSYLNLLLEMSAKFSPIYIDRYGIRPQGMPNLRGLACLIANGSPAVVHVIVLVLSVLVLVWTATRPPSLPLAVLAALLVSYHQVSSDTALMILPIGAVLSGSVAANGKSAVHIVAIITLIVGAVIILFLSNGLFFSLLAIPGMALLVTWDGQRSPLMTVPN